MSATGAVELSAGTRDRLRRAMPAGTRRAYIGDLRRFLAWCADRNLLPAAPDLTDDERLADRALAAHRPAGAGTLRTDGPRQVLRSYRRDRATTGTGVRVHKATPVTIAAPRAMTHALDRNTLVGIGTPRSWCSASPWVPGAADWSLSTSPT